MTGRRLLLIAPFAAAALATSAGEKQTATAATTTTAITSNKPQKCPEWIDGIPVPVEHSSDVCDFEKDNSRAAHNRNTQALRASMTTGRLFRMKDEKTWICPEDEAVVASEDYDQDPLLDADSNLVGVKARWIVRNRSTNPVSVALVDTGRGNKEVSAVNPKISPAHNDPDAVLAPGAWKSVTVTLGTVLNVRELIRAGNDVSPGRVLIRHRPGPVAIRDTTVKPVKKPPPLQKPQTSPASGRKGGKNRGTAASGAKKKRDAAVREDRNLLGSSDYLDLGGNATSPAAKARAKQILQPVLPDATPPLATRAEKEAQRGKFSFDRMCNNLNRLFVNRVGEPVDVYWAGASDLTGTGSAEAVAERARDCEARYAFHLGMKSAPHENFFDDWDSYMSLENSYLGHHFVARLASNHSKVLHEIVLDRTDVGDCVGEREGPSSGRAEEGLAVQVGGKVEESDAKNVMVHEIEVDGYVVVSSNLTATSSPSLGGVGTAAA